MAARKLGTLARTHDEAEDVVDARDEDASLIAILLMFTLVDALLVVTWCSI